MKKIFIFSIILFSFILANNPFFAPTNNFQIGDDRIPEAINMIIPSSPVSLDPTEEITWRIIDSSPPPGRYWCPATGVVRDTIYFLGGRADGGYANSVRSIYAYVPSTNTWINTGLPTLLRTRRAGAGGVIGNKIYVAGGRDSTHTTLNTCEEFDVDTKTVTQKANMPSGRWACCGAVANDKLYVIGDENRTGTTYEYDPVQNTWTTKASLPVGRGWAAAAGAGGKVYVCGGSDASGNALSDCWEFDPVQNTWTQKANMPGPRIYHSVVSYYDTVIFVIGGSVTGTSNADSIVYKYHISTNTWTTETPMNIPRGWLMTNVCNGKIYATYGSNATTPTYLKANEEGSFLPPAARDVGISAIRNPLRIVDPSTNITPIAVVKNFGASSQSNIPIYCWIDSSNVRIYNRDINFPGPLNPGETARVSFPDWLTGPAGTNYQITIFTALENDSNQTNDTAKQTTTTFLVRDTLIAPFTQITPNIDGNIQESEWGDALKWDISDVLNMQGSGPRPAGSVFLYVKHDSNNVYWALDFVAKTTRDNYDQFGCYLDENYSRTWTTDSSEGNHWFVWLNQDTVIYRALIGTGNIPSAYWTRWASGNGISRASTASGHLQFEAVVAKGTQKWNYTINPTNDTVGFYVYVAAGPTGNDMWGTWPTTMPGSNWNNAAAYGTLIFSYLADVSEEKAIILKEIKTNNILRIPLTVKNAKSLSLYDATGKLVVNLHNNTEKNLYWNGKDKNGKFVPNGIYFLKIKTEESEITTKAVILR